jgi:hypothetical protein
MLNHQGYGHGQLDRLYWGIAPVVLAGVVDQVRTTLTVMVAEIRAAMPDSSDVLPAEVASHAINFAVNGGERTTINFTATQGANEITTTAEKEQRHWVRIAAAVAVGLLTIAGVVFALMQAQGWRFG